MGAVVELWLQTEEALGHVIKIIYINMATKITAKIPMAKSRPRRGLAKKSEPSRIRDAKKIGIGTTLEKILEIKGAEDILAKYGVPCLSCPMASFELSSLQIGQVGKMYKLETKKIISALNKLIK